MCSVVKRHFTVRYAVLRSHPQQVQFNDTEALREPIGSSGKTAFSLAGQKRFCRHLYASQQYTHTHTQRAHTRAHTHGVEISGAFPKMFFPAGCQCAISPTESKSVF